MGILFSVVSFCVLFFNATQNHLKAMVTIINLLVGLVVKTTLTVTQTPFNNKSRLESKAIPALGLEAVSYTHLTLPTSDGV